MIVLSSLYEIPIEKLNGIGEKRARLFNKLGIVSVGDLIHCYPRDYEDWSKVTPIAEAETGEVCCVRAYVDTRPSGRMISGGRLLYTMRVSDSSSFAKVLYFNNQYINSMITMGKEYLFYGKVTDDCGTKTMINPNFQNAGQSLPIEPVYSQIAGIPPRQVRNAVKQALGMLPEKINDTLPEELRDKYGLMGLRDALIQIHYPSSQQAMEDAKKRLVFEELLVLVVGLSSLKNLPEKLTGITIKKDHTNDFLPLLPFTLTGAQKRAIDDCIGDMINGGCAMNRLVQGDVGSGKTMVAAAVAFTCIRNGYQAAMMAPTEILARQHFDGLERLFAGTDLNVRLLTGAMTAKQKRETLASLESGEINLIVGTHSLISDNVVFHDLGLVITDEQHRFGVKQRSTLLAKGTEPHLLVMSATPIPRTLALMIYGDLDISIIDELPPGRQVIDTFHIDSSIRQRAYNFMKKNIDSGRQCYIVCPAVDNTDTGLFGVEEYAAKISANEFADYRVGVLHGKMKPADKDAVMNDFIAGNIDVLVSTTVVEVGVDVPNSTIILIENAERFGLSQLHQLRGRVGRGKDKSYCILVSDAKGEEALRRLKTLCATNDGFKIADEDLKMRGPGDFFGSRQHGLPELKIADLAENVDVLRDAQTASKDIMTAFVDRDNDNYNGLRTEVSMLFSDVGTQLN